jgi:hypothetical protein
MWKRTLVGVSKDYSTIYLAGLRKDTINLGENTRLPDQEYNPRSLEYEASVPSTQP